MVIFLFLKSKDVESVLVRIFVFIWEFLSRFWCRFKYWNVVSRMVMISRVSVIRIMLIWVKCWVMMVLEFELFDIFI